VKVTWDAPETGDAERWELCVQDTGPGFQYNSVTPLARALKKATKEAQTLEAESEEIGGPSIQTEPAPTLPSQAAQRPPDPEPGEGIGLSIVKRLCELLDASLELQTERGKGSTFRVIFPRRYDSA
jgi:Histidine kinase-, DNA gyrase B-, and HSP90-like ATPase